MAWSAEVIAALSDTRIAPVYAVEFLAGATGQGVGATSGVLTTHPIDQGLPVLGDVRVGGHSVTIGTWAYQTAEWSFEVRNLDALTWAATLRRGTLVRLHMGFGGWAFRQFQPVALGRIQTVRTERRGIYQVSVWGINTALRSRLVTVLEAAHASAARTAQLCHNAGTFDTKAVTSYTPGDTVFPLNDSTGFEATGGIGATGVVKVTGDSGAIFYLTFTGVSSNSLTGVSTTGQFGTVAEVASVGNLCYNVSYYYGHPLQIAARVLQSTGAGTNGTWDDLGASQGLALPAEMMDERAFFDVANTVVKVASGTYNWEVLVEDPIADAWAWLSALLAEAGIWLVEHQGQVVPRACQDIRSAATVASMAEYVVTDADVVSAALDWFSGDVGTEYTACTVYAGNSHNSSSLTTAVATLPVDWALEYDVSDRVIANEAEVIAEMLARMAPWVLDVPQDYEIVLPLVAWQLAPGDVTRLELSDRWPSGGLVSTVNGLVSRPAMVVDVSPEIESRSVRVRFSVLPTDKADAWESGT